MDHAMIVELPNQFSNIFAEAPLFFFFKMVEHLFDLFTLDKFHDNC